MTSSNNCMGIYQFDDEKKRIFNSIIKPLIGSHTGLTYVDASSYYEPSNIKMTMISKMIEEARLVVADLSEKNPNVFLELGIAYALKKPLVLLCAEKSLKDENIWKNKMTFDLEGRELLIFSDDNDLKVKLGRFISDSLYKTRKVTVSWLSENKDNHIKSPSEIEIFNSGVIWSNVAINSNFIISYHVKIHNLRDSTKNPDIRLYFATSLNGYPRIVSIFPWELSEMDEKKYECHIDYFEDQTGRHHRLQQVSVGKRDIDTIREFDVFVSFCCPNLVFESSFFEDKITRLIVPISDFRNRGFPVHLFQYIGFESINSRVTIDNIMIKEVFL
jgi:hypothetical protein